MPIPLIPAVLRGCLFAGAVLCASFASLKAQAQPKPPLPQPKESDFYIIERFPTPDGPVLEAGASELLPDGRLAVSTRRGEIWMLDKPFAENVSDVKWTRFAHGLHEVLGLAYRDGWLYATQRCELSRLKDEDGDGRADKVETVCDDWEINGDYHEYAFGSRFDDDGNLWVVLCLTGSFNSNVKYRGWCLRITPEGKAVPTCGGIRSPGGIGMNAAGDMFYTDNQGPWNGTCSLKHLLPGSFQGHPAGNRWYDLAPNLVKPQEPQSGSRMMVEAAKIPELVPPAVYFPYRRMGQSASGVACDVTQGKFGPFTNQVFVGDQTASTVMRVSLEKVKNRYQGACFPFMEGFGSGTLSLTMAPNGTLLVGGTNRGWGSRGNQPFAWERVRWTGKTPFEILDLKAQPDGFEFTFTEPVDPETAVNPSSYTVATHTYIYQASYGSPEVDQTSLKILSVTLSPDRLKARLKLDTLTPGHVHEFTLPGLRSSSSSHPLLHNQAYYTLNYIPE